MKRKASRFVVVHAIHSLSLGDELLINYNFHRTLTARQRCLALGLPLDVSLGHKTKKIDSLYLSIYNWSHVNVFLNLKLC